MTIFTDQAPTGDNYINNDVPTANHGTDASFYGGEYNGGAQVARGLLKFDLSAIPSSAVVASATLSLWITTDYATNTRIYRIFRQKRAWTETGSTWNKYDGTNNWQTAGGFGADDCEQTDIGSVSIANNTAVGTEIQWSLTAAAITEMIDGTFSNNGFFIKADTETDDMWGYYAREWTTSGQRPKLVVVVNLYELSNSGALPFSGTATKTTSKPLSGALTFSGTVLKTFQFARTIMAGTITFSGTLTKRINKVLSGAITFIGDLIRRRVIPVDIVLVAAPSVGVVVDGAPADDVTVDIDPTYGVVLS